MNIRGVYCKKGRFSELEYISSLFVKLVVKRSESKGKWERLKGKKVNTFCVFVIPQYIKTLQWVIELW